MFRSNKHTSGSDNVGRSHRHRLLLVLVAMVSGAAQELDVQLWEFTLKAALLVLPLETAGADILEILV
jgi:hypothetical protein